MPKFKKYLITEQGNYYLGYKDRKIIDTKHSVERFLNTQRFKNAGSKLLLNQILYTIRNGMKQILTKYKDKPNIYLIHSKKTKLGIVINWRSDKFSKIKDNQAIIVTILGKREKHFKSDKDDIYLLVEKIEDIILIEIG